MPDIPVTLLGGLSPEAFLDEYWQKKPLLVRGALPDFESPLAPEELAGLACEEDVAARLIVERGGEEAWQVRFGPFDEGDFEGLPETHWTLLVQEVDRWVPEVAALLDPFRFIPRWRIDDVMISYAPEGGGVGAHVDNYDVFLLQGLGRRRWQINHTPVREERLVPDIDVRMLADFTPDEDWVLGPGDLLYLPPRIAHRGVALDGCMTYSIGFRAPSHVEMATAFVNHVAERLDPLARYGDPDLKRPGHPGEIGPDALQKVRGLLRTLVQDDEAIDRWFGAFMTEPKRGLYPEAPDAVYRPDTLRARLQAGAVLRPSAQSRLVFVRHADGTATLFAAGEAYPLGRDLAYAAPLVTRSEGLGAADASLEDGELLGLLAQLVNEGHLVVQAG